MWGNGNNEIVILSFLHNCISPCILLQRGETFTIERTHLAHECGWEIIALQNFESPKIYSAIKVETIK